MTIERERIGRASVHRSRFCRHGAEGDSRDRRTPYLVFVLEFRKAPVRPSVIRLAYLPPSRARHGVREEEAGWEELENSARIGFAAGQQGVLRLQPARADLRQHDDRLVRLHLLLWYAVSNSASSLRSHPQRTQSVVLVRSSAKTECLGAYTLGFSSELPYCSACCAGSPGPG